MGKPNKIVSGTIGAPDPWAKYRATAEAFGGGLRGLGRTLSVGPSNIGRENFSGISTATTISQLGFVFFALAAAAVVLDQAFGYSSSWMRSRLAELELRKLIGSFQIEVRSVLACASEKLPADNAKALVDRVTKFAADADDIVVGETQRIGSAESKAGLLQVEQISRVSREANEQIQTCRTYDKFGRPTRRSAPKFSIRPPPVAAGRPAGVLIP